MWDKCLQFKITFQTVVLKLDYFTIEFTLDILGAQIWPKVRSFGFSADPVAHPSLLFLAILDISRSYYRDECNAYWTSQLLGRFCWR